MSLKVAEFLEPCGADGDELRHTLANTARSASIDRRYEVLGLTLGWQSFSSHNIHNSPILRRSLEVNLLLNGRLGSLKFPALYIPKECWKVYIPVH